MAVHLQEMSIEINAEPEDCFKVICDFSRYPQWVSFVKKVNILKVENMRPRIVEFIVNLSVLPKDFRYVLDYKYDDIKNLLTWTYVEGSLRDVQGEYSFKLKSPGITIATYKLAVDPGFWVPEIIKNKIINIGMKGSMEAFKKEVETRYGGVMKAGSHPYVSP